MSLAGAIGLVANGTVDAFLSLGIDTLVDILSFLDYFEAGRKQLCDVAGEPQHRLWGKKLAKG